MKSSIIGYGYRHGYRYDHIISPVIIIFIIIFPLVMISTLARADLVKMDLLHALELYKKGSYVQVINELNNIKSSDHPKDYKRSNSIHYLKGLSHNKLQEFDNAIKEFELSIKEGNTSPDIYYELGQAYYASRDMRNARKNFESSYKNNYLSESSLYYIGYISQMLEEYPIALESYGKIRDAKDGLGQSARFQAGEILLVQAEANQGKRANRKDVSKNILPIFVAAYEIDETSSLSKQIGKRIVEVKEKYNLDENKMINGRRLSPKKYSLKYKETVEHDSNVVSEADQSTAKANYTSSLILKSDLSAKNLFAFKRRYLVTPETRLTHTRHTTHRDNSNIQKNDAYSIQPKIKGGLEHTLFAKMGTTTFETEFNYTAKDDEANGHLRHSGRTWSFSLEEKLAIWARGDSTLKIKHKQYDAKTDSSDSYTNNFSLIQLISFANTHTIMGLFNADFTTNTKSESNSQNSYLTRVDYIVPTFLIDNLQASGAFAFTVTDTKLQKSSRGTETTLNPSLTIGYKFLKYFEASLRYEYSKTNSKDKAAYDYKKHLVGLDIEVGI